LKGFAGEVKGKGLRWWVCGKGGKWLWLVGYLSRGHGVGVLLGGGGGVVVWGVGVQAEAGGGGLFVFHLVGAAPCCGCKNPKHTGKMRESKEKRKGHGGGEKDKRGGENKKGGEETREINCEQRRGSAKGPLTPIRGAKDNIWSEQRGARHRVTARKGWVGRGEKGTGLKTGKMHKGPKSGNQKGAAGKTVGKIDMQTRILSVAKKRAKSHKIFKGSNKVPCRE